MFMEIQNMGKRKEVDLKKIKNDRIRKVVSIALKHNISPTTMAHILGVSYATYNRYVDGKTIPQSQNTWAIVDNVIKNYK